MNIRFIKLSGKWFADIPWDGDIDTNDENGEITLHKIKEDEFFTGCYYKVNSFQFKGEIWLCNVTKHVFGEFPNKITFNVI